MHAFMVVTARTRLGPYEIVAALGAGGMGEVYRARDSRLERTVAIKILPAHLSSNTELKARFDREARAASALNHPHICHLYDVGSRDGTAFLVMEYLEGETLADRLRKGALPLEPGAGAWNPHQRCARYYLCRCRLAHARLVLQEWSVVLRRLPAYASRAARRQDVHGLLDPVLPFELSLQ